MSLEMATKSTCDVVDDLSDGEVISTSTEEMEEDTVSTDHIDKSLSRKDDDQCIAESDGEGGDWTLVTKGPPPRKRKSTSNHNNGRKKKKKKMAAVSSVSPAITYITNEQRSLLRILCELVSVTSGAGENGGPSMIVKTGDFKAVIRHLVLGDPVMSKKSKLIRASELRNKRILVVWLSCVSKDDFHASPDHFKGLKAIKSTVGFSLKHPGSEKFVKFGLETFVGVDDPTASTKPCQVTTDEFNKIHCLMSLDDLQSNDFPIPATDKADPLPDGFFQLTPWSDQVNDEIASFPMFAIDCEMVETEDGKSALARISVINEDMNCIYNTLVKPALPITDYRTSYSGITEDMMKNLDQTLVDVQRELKELLPGKCILVGHSIECDFKVLKLCHPYVIDTSMLFTPGADPYSKPGLKHVTKHILDLDIQTGGGGHDPTEDALACMKLVKKKLEGGPKLNLKWKNSKSSIFHLFSKNSVPVSLIDRRSFVRLYGKSVPSGCVTVKSDEEAVEEAKEQVLDARFTFMQLHGVQYYKNSDIEDQSADAFQRELDMLDKHVCELISSCCQETLIMVVCGSGYIKEVRKFQTAAVIDESALAREVNTARSGYVVAMLK